MQHQKGIAHEENVRGSYDPVGNVCCICGYEACYDEAQGSIKAK